MSRYAQLLLPATLLLAACACPSERDPHALAVVALADEGFEVVSEDYIGPCICDAAEQDDARIAELRRRRLSLIQSIRNALAAYRKQKAEDSAEGSGR